MFEDQNTSAGSPPPNLPIQPEDMLASVDDTQSSVNSLNSSQPDALSAGLLKPRVSTMPPAPEPSTAQLTYSTKSPVLGKVLGVIIGLLVLAGIVFAGWWVYTRIIKAPQPPSTLLPQTPVDVPTTTVVVPPVTTSSAVLPGSTTTLPVSPVLTGDTTDSDHDGLTDEEERFYGTDPQKIDTDGDGLSDFEEVKVWDTDPLHPDTDGDGYKDGDEVKNGYNPKGPGKLFNIPTTTPVFKPTSSASTSSVPNTASTSSVVTPTTSLPVQQPSRL
jgi:hypothetical protein